MQLAQTNLQLLAQMWRDGYPLEDLKTVSSAYWLAAEAFSGKVRASGKPFLCHLVGTASAAASERPPVHVVAAAVCHGISELGDFGQLSLPARDRLIAERLGPDAVALLARYSTMQEHRASEVASVMRIEPAQATEEERWSALIWAANEADDEIDAGSRFRRDRSDRDTRKDLSFRLTRHFGWNELERLLAVAQAEHDAAAWAEPLATPRENSLTFARRNPESRPNVLRRLYWALGRRLRRTSAGTKHGL